MIEYIANSKHICTHFKNNLKINHNLFLNEKSYYRKKGNKKMILISKKYFMKYYPKQALCSCT